MPAIFFSNDYVSKLWSVHALKLAVNGVITLSGDVNFQVGDKVGFYSTGSRYPINECYLYNTVTKQKLDFPTVASDKSNYTGLVAPENNNPNDWVVSAKHGVNQYNIVKTDINPNIYELNDVPEPEPEPEPDFEITQDFVDLISVNGIVATVNGDVVGLGDGIPVGSTLVFTLANGTFNYIDWGYDSASGMPIEFTLSNGNTVATLNNFPSGMFGLPTISASIPEPEPEPEPEPDFEITQDFVDLISVNGIVATVNGDVVGLGDGVPVGSTLVFTLANGTFNYVSWGYDSASGMPIEFTLSNGNTVATLNNFPSGMFGLPTISASIPEPEPEPEQRLSLLSSYSLDETDLTKLADARNAIFNDGAGGDVDFSKYFLSLYRLPFKIPDEIIEIQKQIEIGFYETNIIADYLSKNYFTFDMGVINVPLVENNLLDFVNTVCFLHLPYADSVSIDNEYVIGESLSIKYEINVFTGDAVINVFSSKIESAIYTKEIKFGLDIPYAPKKDSENIVISDQIGLGNDNKVMKPFIEIMRNEVVLKDGFFTIPITDENLLINEKGFIKIDEINLKVKAGRDEKEMILNAINQGVIIK